MAGRPPRPISLPPPQDEQPEPNELSGASYSGAASGEGAGRPLFRGYGKTAGPPRSLSGGAAQRCAAGPRPGRPKSRRKKLRSRAMARKAAFSSALRVSR